MQRPTSLTLTSRPSMTSRRNRLMSEPTTAAHSPVSCAPPSGTPSIPFVANPNRVRTPSGYSKHVSSQPSTPVIQEGFYFPAVPPTAAAAMYAATAPPSTTLYGTLPKVTTAPHPSRGVTPAATILETSHPSLLANPPAPYSHCCDTTLPMTSSHPMTSPRQDNLHYMSLPRNGRTPPIVT